MLKNYLKIALRNIRKHKAYSFINISGLAVGMACTLLILLWVQDELSFDRFHANAKTLFRVEQDQNFGGQGTFHVYVTPYPMGPGLKEGIPEIKDTARVARPGTLLIRYGEKAFFETATAAADPSFLWMFTFPLVRGRAETALSEPRSLVLSEDLAKKYFGSEDPMGKAVTVNNAYAFTVTGVMKNMPENSSLRAELAVPFDFVKELGQYIDSWGNNNILTWVQLYKGSSVSAANQKITRLVWDRTLQEIRSDPETMKRIEKDPEAMKRLNSYAGPQFMLMPLTDIRLHAYFGFGQQFGTAQYVGTFAAIALFVLLIACINFMNLATARSANRAKEVGLRKVVGAFRRNIAGQFYGESIMTTFLAVMVSLGLVILLLPAFNNLSAKKLPLAALLDWKFILGILAVASITGVVSGSYPAAFLSSFHPVRVLKGSLNAGARSALFRKTLVVIQFGLSILLLIGTGVVYRQLEYMRNKKLGYDKEHLIYLPLRGDTPKTYAALKEELLNNSEILGVTGTHQPPTSIGSNGWGADWDGKDPEKRVLIGQAFTDFDYPETLKIEMAAGRPFSKAFSMDQGRTFLVNEEVPKLMGIDAASAVGKRFKYMGVDGTIVGVMKNYHYQPVQNAIEPLAIIVNQANIRYAIVRLRAGDIPASIETVKSAWKKVNPLYPLDYVFFDQDFGRMFQSDERMGTLLKYFAALAVIIACLGLFGLASFTAEQRTKEIGVRKVLGASVAGIILLLSKEFAKWVVIANVFAWPVGFFVMRKWLQGFAYRTGIAWWLFALAGAGALVVAMVTVSVQAFKAARANPVNALKYE